MTKHMIPVSSTCIRHDPASHTEGADSIFRFFLFQCLSMKRHSCFKLLNFHDTSQYFDLNISFRNTNPLYYISPIPVAARSKMWFCDRSPGGTAGPNPTGSMDVCPLSVSCVVRVEESETGRSLVQRSPTECSVSENDLDTSTMRKCTLTTAIEILKKSIFKYNNNRSQTTLVYYSAAYFMFTSHKELRL